jgi:hypothetical protein
MSAMVAAFLPLAPHQVQPQPAAGVTADQPQADAPQPPTGPGRSRLPLIDPKVFPPGGFGTPQDRPTGEPGASPNAPGHTGGATGRSGGQPR